MCMRLQDTLHLPQSSQELKPGKLWSMECLSYGFLLANLAIPQVQMLHAHRLAWAHLSCVAEACSCLTPHRLVQLWQALTSA